MMEVQVGVQDVLLITQEKLTQAINQGIMLEALCNQQAAELQQLKETIDVLTEKLPKENDG